MKFYSFHQSLYQFLPVSNKTFLKVEEIFEFIWTSNLNPYDLYRDCNSNFELNKSRMRAMKFGLTAPPFDLLQSNKPVMKQKPQKSLLTYLKVSLFLLFIVNTKKKITFIFKSCRYI